MQFNAVHAVHAVNAVRQLQPDHLLCPFGRAYKGRPQSRRILGREHAKFVSPPSLLCFSAYPLQRYPAIQRILRDIAQRSYLSRSVGSRTISQLLEISGSDPLPPSLSSTLHPGTMSHIHTTPSARTNNKAIYIEELYSSARCKWSVKDMLEFEVH